MAAVVEARPEPAPVAEAPPEVHRLLPEAAVADPVRDNLWSVLLLLGAILVTALGIVYTKHVSRKLFVELQTLASRRDDLDIEWEQLQLEQSTLATETVIDQAARERLDMVIPAPDAVIYVIR